MRMRPIYDHPTYLISDDGRVLREVHIDGVGRLRPARWLRTWAHEDGHIRVSLYCKGHQHIRYVHRLILEAFVGPCPDGMECRHANGNPADNRLENLRWGTRSENQRDAVKHGTAAGFGNRGERCSAAKLSEEQVRQIIREGYREPQARREMAERCGVTETTIRDILSRRTWRHLGLGVV